MKNNSHFQSPYQSKFSINSFIENFVMPSSDELKSYYDRLFTDIKKIVNSNLSITDVIESNQSVFEEFFNIIIPKHLSDNEYKIISLPFENQALFKSEKLRNTELNMPQKNNLFSLNEDEIYKLKGTLIIKHLYKNSINSDAKNYYEFIDANGILKSFYFLQNTDFLSIYPVNESYVPTRDQVTELLSNADDIDLWKKILPPNSWVVEGFCIVTLINYSIENSLSKLKSNLLGDNYEKVAADESYKLIFRSIFEISDLKIGIALINEEEEELVKTKFNESYLHSFILNQSESKNIIEIEKDSIVNGLFVNEEPVLIQNLDEFDVSQNQSKSVTNCIEQNVKSLLLAPIISNNSLLGILEFVSATPYALNSNSLARLHMILPILASSLERNFKENEHKIDAIIQQEYTSIHPSVYWKFRQVVTKFLKSNKNIEEYNFKDIVFEDVYALFGQIDIKNSTQNRQIATIEDLKKQIQYLLEILENIQLENKLIILDQIKYELNRYLNEITSNLETTTENYFKKFLENEVHPLLRAVEKTEALNTQIESYFDKLDKKLEIIYDNRKAYDSSVSFLNKKIASFLDERQIEAQQIFPHYYERYATDGIEHNLYIGASINPKLPFNTIYFNNLRLWQLKALAETVYNYQKWKHVLDFSLEITTLILAFSAPITIRFRLDEKQFDVDGSYNARYEVVKKRIDKSHVKNSEERITQENKITIVYAQNSEKIEYTKYLKFLMDEGLLEPEIEKLEVEDLQSVSGLRALRVKVKSID